MKCDLCGERPAVMLVQQISKDSTVELHLCEECARARGFSAGPGKVEVSLAGIFNGLIDGKEEDKRACPRCGTALADIRKRRRVGCADCYLHFRAEILAVLRREGIEVRYRGELPPKIDAFKPLSADRASLRKELEKALAHEEYEMAAYYRDRLRALGEEG